MTTKTLDRYSEYDAWGWFYNQTMGPAYAKTQFVCLEKLLLTQVSPPAKLLDVCCGTGHLVRLLTVQGYQVMGIDGSEQMLQFASKNAPEANFQLADVRYFDMPQQQFDAAFSTSASLNHMMGLNELELVLRRVYHSLKPGGLLLFDLNHHKQMEKWWRDRVAEGEIGSDDAWSIRPAYNPANHQGAFTVTMYRRSDSWKIMELPKYLLYRFLQLDLRRTKQWRYQLLAQFGRWQPTWQKSQVTYEVYGFEIGAVTDLLKRLGFQTVQVCDLNGSPNVDVNHSAYFLCHKAEA